MEKPMKACYNGFDWQGSRKGGITSYARRTKMTAKVRRIPRLPMN